MQRPLQGLPKTSANLSISSMSFMSTHPDLPSMHLDLPSPLDALTIGAGRAQR
jgi:hypothetical protein